MELGQLYKRKFWKSQKNLQSSLKKNWMLRQPLLYWLPTHPFLKFILPLTQLVGPPMETYHSLCSSCVTYGTLCSATGHQVLPTHHVILHPPVNHCQVFRFILYFQTSPVQGDSRPWLTHPFFTMSATDLRKLFLLSGVFYLPLLIPREAEDFP